MPPESAARVTLGDALLALWRLARPETWMVSILPMLVGWVLASHELVPGLGLWIDFWHGAAQHGQGSATFLATCRAWLPVGGPVLLGALACGPLLWAATLLINDVHDVPGDRANPRKAASPLVQGTVSVRFAHVFAYVCGLLALVVAALVNWTFAVLALLCLVLAWLYSVPPIRLKTRPGADLLVNALGIGFLSGAAGWSIAQPLVDFPFAFIPQGLLVAAAIYVPTTIVDHDADRQAGYTTLATKLGARRAYLVGWWSWVACNLGALGLSAADAIIPRRMLPILLVFVPLMLYQYHAFIGKAQSPAERVKGIIFASLTFLCVNLLFALMYTGLWV